MKSRAPGARSGKSLWPSVLACGLLGLAMLSACRRDSKPPADTPPKSVPSSPTALLGDWKNPQAIFVFSGDEHGHMEPCGCSEKQPGGFAHRADFLKKLREDRNWPVAAFNVGGTLDETRVGYPQAAIKFDAITRGLAKMDYAALVLGKPELQLGAQDLLTQHANLEADEQLDLPFLDANVTIFGTKELGTPINTRILKVGQLTVGVTAVVGKTTRTELDVTGVTADENEVKVDDPADVVPGIIEQLQAESPDLLVLLSNADVEESKQLAQQFPQFDIVVTSNGPETLRSDLVYVGDTLLVQVGQRGKTATVVGYFGPDNFKQQVVDLDADRFGSAPEMVELMRYYQNRLQRSWPELSQFHIPDPPQGSFVGAETCGQCHTYAFKVWSNTKHAHAYESLIKGRPGKEAEWVSRIYDPECLTCHVTGWAPQQAQRYASGFVDIEQTPHLAGQQCENCHGAGSAHVELEQAVKQGSNVDDAVLEGRKSMQLTLSRAREQTCRKCHDPDNSPHFDFDTYWPKVNHTGRKD